MANNLNKLARNTVNADVHSCNTCPVKVETSQHDEVQSLPSVRHQARAQMLGCSYVSQGNNNKHGVDKCIKSIEQRMRGIKITVVRY